MRTEHVRPLLDNEVDSNRFFEVSQAFAHAKIPDEIVSALRVVQLTALQKPNGGVRGVGDVIRRLVAKTMSQQLMAKVENASKPSQYALSTRAGYAGDDRVVHRRSVGFRLDLTQSHDGSPSLDARGWRHPPIRLAILRPPFNTFVGRRRGGGPGP